MNAPLADPQVMAQAIQVPAYLEKLYWWAYVHPLAVRFFERQWLVNAILWGNFGRLRDAAIEALGASLPGRTLQVACVYGDLTERLAARLPANGELDVIDVLPIQLRNLRRKLPPAAAVALHHADSRALSFADASFDRVLVFFLLHEQPAEVREATLAEALRVLRPGGRLVVVDYHQPHFFHPLRLPLWAVLRRLEPYALALWRNDIGGWLPAGAARLLRKRKYFGGLYQRLEFERSTQPAGRAR